MKQFSLENPGAERFISGALNRHGHKRGFAILESSWFPLAQDQAAAWVLLEPIDMIQFARGVLERDRRASVASSSPWHALKDFFEERTIPYATGTPPHLVGYCTYELLHQLEEVPLTGTSTHILPLFQFWRYRTCLHVPYAKEQKITCFQFDIASAPLWDIDIPALTKDLPPSSHHKSELVDLSDASLEEALAPFSNFTKADYLDAIRAIIELIRYGEAYEVNISQMFTLPTESAHSTLYGALREVSPAPRAAFLQCTDGGDTIISNSPETFFTRKGDTLRCAPIKGTAPRGPSLEVDRAYGETLVHSEKDYAELAMVVDLLRNDMGRVSKPGSVHVVSHARLESYAHVHHLVSEIESTVDSKIDCVDLIRALFPCGSISGAPKIAAMKTIANIEHGTRGIYTGAIIALAGANQIESSVAIRTGLALEASVLVGAGGGITYGSDPEREYFETLHKMRSWYLAWKRCGSMAKRDRLLGG